MIKAQNLFKRFKTLVAVDRVSFKVKKGEIFGLLGPNGAGKTTTIRMLTGVLKPDKGRALVGGHDVAEQPIEAKQIMGIVPEMANAYIDLSAARNLILMGELYGVKQRRQKAKDLLKMFNLYSKRDVKAKTLSKGMNQRLIIAMALMNDAQVLFLDEPTTGLDVESTRLIREIIKKQEDKTILLTTHNIGEASSLCNRVAIMNKGKIVAIDRPSELKQTVESASSIEVSFKNPENDFQLEGFDIKKSGDKYKIYTDNPEDLIPEIVKYSEKTNNKIISINTLGPTLEDVFLKLTK